MNQNFADSGIPLDSLRSDTALIGLFVFILSFVVQILMSTFERDRRLAGRWATSQQGPLLIMSFDGGGQASWFTPDEKEFSATSALGHGQWTQFPEGTVVRWTDKICAGNSCGDVGLISASDGYLIYEGYNERILGVPEFDARLNPLAVPHDAGA
jgi:hypothetical protein